MNTVHIAVQYPLVEDIVVRTEAEARAMGYKNAVVQHMPVNRPQNIVVKKLIRKVQEEFMDAADYRAETTAMCVAQTGMTPEEYQARYNRAWNE